jgi:hypothetical protein
MTMLMHKQKMYSVSTMEKSMIAHNIANKGMITSADSIMALPP